MSDNVNVLIEKMNQESIRKEKLKGKSIQTQANVANAGGDGGYVSIDDRGKQNIQMSNKAQRVVSGKRSEYSPKPIAV